MTPEQEMALLRVIADYRIMIAQRDMHIADLQAALEQAQSKEATKKSKR